MDDYIRLAKEDRIRVFELVDFENLFENTDIQAISKIIQLLKRFGINPVMANSYWCKKNEICINGEKVNNTEIVLAFKPAENDEISKEPVKVKSLFVGEKRLVRVTDLYN